MGRRTKLGGHCAVKYVRGGGQVLENESGWRCMPGRRYGSKLSSVGPQPGDEVGDVSVFVGGRGEELPR